MPFKNIKKVIEQNKKCDKIIIVVGPEGGFEKSEENLLIDNGFISTSLGKNVLRAETAPVAVVSMIKYEFMRWHYEKFICNLKWVRLTHFTVFLFISSELLFKRAVQTL